MEVSKLFINTVVFRFYGIGYCLIYVGDDTVSRMDVDTHRG